MKDREQSCPPTRNQFLFYTNMRQFSIVFRVTCSSSQCVTNFLSPLNLTRRSSDFVATFSFKHEPFFSQGSQMLRIRGCFFLPWECFHVGKCVARNRNPICLSPYQANAMLSQET